MTSHLTMFDKPALRLVTLLLMLSASTPWSASAQDFTDLPACKGIAQNLDINKAFQSAALNAAISNKNISVLHKWNKNINLLLFAPLKVERKSAMSEIQPLLSITGLETTMVEVVSDANLFVYYYPPPIRETLLIRELPSMSKTTGLSP